MSVTIDRASFSGIIVHEAGVEIKRLIVSHQLMAENVFIILMA